MIVNASGMRFCAAKVLTEKKHKKRKKTGAYKKRDETLSGLGYESYAEYLKSDDWKKIRESVLAFRGECECCGKKATQVHHYCYNISVLLGMHKKLLVSICDGCHEDVEYDGKNKRTLQQAQQRLCEMLPQDRVKAITNEFLKASKRESEQQLGKWRKRGQWYH